MAKTHSYDMTGKILNSMAFVMKASHKILSGGKAARNDTRALLESIDQI